MSKRVKITKTTVTLTPEQVKHLAEVYLQNPHDTENAMFLVDPNAVKTAEWTLEEHTLTRPLIFVG